MTDSDRTITDVPSAGGVIYSVGQAAVVRIPIPGQPGLCIELRSRGWVPQGGSTSTLFFQDTRGKRQLRLDYGFNPRTKTIDYHWNQKGVAATFGVTDHSAAGKAGKVAYQAAKYFKHAGRVLVVVGIVVDGVSVVQASKPLRRATEVVAGWAGTWAGCKVVGAGGAALGSVAPLMGTAAGGIGGCIIGGIGGYHVASSAAGQVYDWTEGTVFMPLPTVSAP